MVRREMWSNVMVDGGWMMPKRFVGVEVGLGWTLMGEKQRSKSKLVEGGKARKSHRNRSARHMKMVVEEGAKRFKVAPPSGERNTKAFRF